MKSILKKIGLTILALVLIVFLAGFVWYRYQVHCWKKSWKICAVGNEKFNVKKYSEAISNYSEAIRLNEYPSHFYNQRGVAKGRMGDFQGELDDLNKAIYKNPTNEIYLSNRGQANYELGDDKAAISDFSAAIVLNPENGTNYFWRSRSKYLSGDTFGALADVNKAIELAPQFGLALKKRSEWLKELNSQKP